MTYKDNLIVKIQDEIEEDKALKARTPKADADAQYIAGRIAGLESALDLAKKA